MQCRDIMKKDVQRVRPDDIVRTAAVLMASYGVGFLPVCDESGKPIGTITDRDIVVRCVAYDYPSTIQVSEVMTADVVACSPDDSLDRAEELMAEKKKSRIMCVDSEGYLCGVISLSDLPGNSSQRHLEKVFLGVTERETRKPAQA